MPTNTYGGLGGIDGVRPVEKGNRFEEDIEELFGEQIREDPQMAAKMWTAIVNNDWIHEESGETAGYTFRSAGDLVAAIRGGGSYHEWYCSNGMVGLDYGEVVPEIAESMKSKGWIYRECEV